MIYHREDLTLRQARAFIRYRVRKRLAEYRGQDIWRTAFFIDRLDLATEVFRFQAAQSTDGTPVGIDGLVAIAKEEFVDFVLLEDVDRRIELSEQRATIVCEVCSQRYDASGRTACPHCSHTNLFQITEMELEALAEQIEPAINDPVARRFLADTEELRIENAYLRVVTCFETFHRGLNQLAFAMSGAPEVRLSRPNLFQNIRHGWDWMLLHHCIDLSKGLIPEDVYSLERVFNKRHVIIHNGGIIDRRYIERTGSDPAKVGERVDLHKREVLKAINLVTFVLHTAKEALPL